MLERLLFSGAAVSSATIWWNTWWPEATGCEVDIKHPQFEPSPAHEFEIVALRRAEGCLTVTCDGQPNLPPGSDMGIGHITADRAKVARNNTLLDVQVLDAARFSNFEMILFSSSACVSPEAALQPLREDDAWPEDPDDGHGLEKLYMEKLCQYCAEDFGLETRVARFHNIYGSLGGSLGRGTGTNLRLDRPAGGASSCRYQRPRRHPNVCESAFSECIITTA